MSAAFDKLLQTGFSLFVGRVRLICLQNFLAGEKNAILRANFLAEQNMSVTIYGISNCDTVKKARNWLQQHSIDFTFHDFRKDGISNDQLDRWLRAVGGDLLINKRSTTWKGLNDAEKQQAEQTPLPLLQAKPTLIKRPVLDIDGTIEIGFKDSRYTQLFNKDHS